MRIPSKTALSWASGGVLIGALVGGLMHRQQPCTDADIPVLCAPSDPNLDNENQELARRNFARALKLHGYHKIHGYNAPY